MRCAVGDWYDNAMAESFFASMEKELIHQQRRRRFATRSEAELKIFEYIEGFYNRTRLHSALVFNRRWNLNKRITRWQQLRMNKRSRKYRSLCWSGSAAPDTSRLPEAAPTLDADATAIRGVSLDRFADLRYPRKTDDPVSFVDARSRMG